MQGLDLVEDVWKAYNSNIRQSIISKCDTQSLELFLGKVYIVDHSHHLCHKSTSHIAMCVR